MNNIAKHTFPRVQTRKIPVTSFIRFWILGSAQAKVAVSYLNYLLRRGFLNDNDRQRAIDHLQLQAALQLLGSMGYLRGAVMKFGQLLANMPQIAGEEITEIFQSLHFEAPPMHYSLIREVFLDELGKEPEELFSSFEKVAFAAASLGQVHRARLHDGTEVAVKIQYPDIGRTIESDFKTLVALLQTIRFRQSYQNLISHVVDAKDVFIKEVDYIREATFMEENRKIFTGTKVVVPKYYKVYSTPRVLTMDYLEGDHLPTFLAHNPSQTERNHYGELISFSLIRSFFSFHTIYSDMHPGNFLFMKDGRIGFIDFGCYQRFSEDRWNFEIASEKAMLKTNLNGILKFIARVARCSHIEKLDPIWVETTRRQIDWVIRPIMAKRKFDFADQAYVQEGIDLFREINAKRTFGKLDCFYNWTNRALLGHRALMYQLRAKFDYRSLYLGEMHRSGIDIEY